MSEHMQNTVQFLKDQEALYDPQVYEPVVMIKKEKIVFASGVRIDSFVKLEGGEGLRIGTCVHIASFAHVNIGGGYVVIDDYAAIASGAKIVAGSNLTHAISLSAVAPKDMQEIKKFTVGMERYSCLFVNAVMLPGSWLSEGAVLAANSTLMPGARVPEWEIWGGTPAKFLKKRQVTVGREYLEFPNEVP